MNELWKNYTNAVPFARVLKESWGALISLLYRFSPQYWWVSLHFASNFLQTVWSNPDFVLLLRKVFIQTPLQVIILELKKTKTVKHNLKLCKKISSSSSFYHKYFANILYSFYNKTGNLAQFTEYSQHKKWIQVKKKLNVVCS